MRSVQHRVELGEARRRLAYVYAARYVRAVADVVGPGHGPADVEQHTLAGTDDALTGFMVGAGRIRT